MKLLVIVMLTACFIFSVGCQDKAPEEKATEEVDRGAFAGSLYRNNYFGMTITIPSDWSIQDSKSMKTLKDRGKKALGEDDRHLKAVMDATEHQTVNLFSVFQHPIGSPVPFNSNLICMAERVRHMPGIKRGKDYHYHTRKLLESSQMKVKFPEEIYTETLGSVEFDVLYSETSFGNILVKQKQYGAIMKGYVLLIVSTFANDDQETTLNEILETLTFN
jgi:hypothetical protein